MTHATDLERENRVKGGSLPEQETTSKEGTPHLDATAVVYPLLFIYCVTFAVAHYRIVTLHHLESTSSSDTRIIPVRSTEKARLPPSQSPPCHFFKAFNPLQESLQARGSGPNTTINLGRTFGAPRTLDILLMETNPNSGIMALSRAE